ncbi:hypothetical protein [Paenibacillus sp. FJAT-26967]|uniref:hypothetical protein n=1 Tax=Paenibacillus sp. FJAT-26967 TaxID=1729690 RepID=UPI0008385110|nr:hypothetical protein [Paenibacillus sp. FJAT-26967]
MHLISRTRLSRIGTLAVTGALLLSLWSAGPVQANQVPPPAAAAQSADDYQQFIKEQFGYSLPPSPTKGDFILAVAGVLGLQSSGIANPFQDISVTSSVYKPALALYESGILTSDILGEDQPLTQSTALYIAVKAAGLKELAYTYPADKAAKALAKIQPGEAPARGLTPQAAQELAAAVDTGLLPETLHAGFELNKPASASFGILVLGKVLEAKGLYKHYLGSVSDPDITRIVRDAWRYQSLVQQPELQDTADQALQAGLITGYNIKDNRFTPNFEKQRTLTYGHSEIDHALQLIGLLRSEGIDAKVQLEPKTSAFIYLKEWGEPVQTDDYKVVQIKNGNFIAYAKEYDLSLEFVTAGQKARFQDIVLQYAKKDSEDQTGLIAHSWWQPLYYSRTELADYEVITNNKITKGHHYVQSFSLNEQSEAIAAGFKKISPQSEVETYKFWVDGPFYNYLLGESK